ncbi:MAG TPA: phospholipase D-like domain-containing protein, partial [Candidatus Hydrogenedentes bacterium]|nr:phospholipase D-like domain-containing protein [Candidatus Hydrogenedentota bacterium]
MSDGKQTETENRAKDLFIVDNSDSDWKVKSYLQEWTELAHKFDIATGYFEIGALLALDGHWQKLDKLRILMGDEVSLRTKRAFVQGLKNVEKVLDASIEKEKESNDFLHGVPGIVEAIRSNKIECRVYTKDKFHAKAFITHGKHAVVGSTALVGSSNFTYPGLTDNVELNVQIQREVRELQEWYERHWDDAKDISEDILRIIERHTREYTPFEVYAKALQEYFRGHELTADEWEKTHSQIYRHLDQYQKEGYHALLKISRQHNGAFLCDGVGLGKTFIGMMLIERLTMYDRKRVALFVPKAARKPVWEAALRKYLPDLGGDFTNLVIYNHTDLQRAGDFRARVKRLKDTADVIIMDEAHHFRNPGTKGLGHHTPSRYWEMFNLCEDKQVIMLTATPINNSLLDLQHMIELFSRREAAYFKNTLGIHSLAGHFRKMEKSLEKSVATVSAPEQAELPIDLNPVEAGEVLTHDALFRALVVQRSRAYVRKSQEQHGGSRAIFPDRQAPQVADYSIKKTYGRLLKKLEDAFSKEKPLFSLAIYYPLAYYNGPNEEVDTKLENRQRQVVGLIRVQFLKRFESSARAFQMSCQALMLKLLAFATKYSV